MTTRQLRIQLPPHPEPSLLERLDSTGNDVKDEMSLGLLDFKADPVGENRNLEQGHSEQLRQEYKERDKQQQQQQQKQQQLREGERQLQKRQQQQQGEQHEQEQQRQLQLVESTLANTPLSPTALRSSSPRRPHVVRRMASKVAAVVREGTRKMILRHSPRGRSQSPSAAGLGAPTADAVDGEINHGDAVSNTKEGEEGSRAPNTGEAAESCPADRLASSSSSHASKGVANPTTMDIADTHPTTFFPEPQPQEEQEGQQQWREQDHQVQKGRGCMKQPCRPAVP